MKIVLVCDFSIPVSSYDDKERMVWWLGKEFSKLGHEVTFLLKEGKTCEFGNISLDSPK